MATVAAGSLAPPALVAAAPSRLAVARAGLWTLFAAHAVAGWGTQWDIQWHMRIGRDSFWIAPHVITYSGVTLLVLASFGVLAWTTLRGDGGADTLRIAGLVGTRGYHLAAWGIALTVLAAPIDDLWHRLFGLDVTLWSPPHMLGLLGGAVNAAACWWIATEAYPVGSRARQVALVLATGFVYGSVGLGLQPSVRIAYVFGGVRFFTYPILAALLTPAVLVLSTRLTGWRFAPALAPVVVVALGAVGDVISRAGFAWLRPVSVIGEAIAQDPTSPIAIGWEIARKNGTAVGAWVPRLLAVTFLAALVMGAVDARRRPLAASLAYALTLFVLTSVSLARLPAFADSLPSAPDTAVALALTALATLLGYAITRRVTGAAPR
jgi:hypothetical protein